MKSTEQIVRPSSQLRSGRSTPPQKLARSHSAGPSASPPLSPFKPPAPESVSVLQSPPGEPMVRRSCPPLPKWVNPLNGWSSLEMPGTTWISSKMSGSASGDPSDELLTRLCFTKWKEGSCEARPIIDPSTMGSSLFDAAEGRVLRSETNRRFFDDGLVSFPEREEVFLFLSPKVCTRKDESSLSDFSPSVTEGGLVSSLLGRSGSSLSWKERVVLAKPDQSSILRRWKGEKEREVDKSNNEGDQ